MVRIQVTMMMAMALTLLELQAAKNNNEGVVGIAPGARLWAVKVLNGTGSGPISTIIAGIDYVTQHANEIDVANLSFGCECPSKALDTAIHNSVGSWNNLCGCDWK